MTVNTVRRRWQTALWATTALAAPHAALAQTTPPTEATAATTAAPQGFEDIVVTATKRAESLQNVPISIQALGTAKLDQLQVTSFDDYVKFLPSVSYQSVGPGTAQVYFRGVSSGGRGNHSGPLPAVGIYLDEQPISTVQGALDIHVYDIARVEALAGPQGTLYGASSLAGTIRIISNKPDPSKFSGSMNAEVSQIDHGGLGYVGEAYANYPIGDHAAIRLVGWVDHAAGYIDNVPGTRTYPVSGVTLDNSAIAKKDYNTVDTYGGRGALLLEIGDSWTVTPAVMGQIQQSKGVFGFDESLGDLKVSHFTPEKARDSWIQAALTIEGKIHDFDIVYAAAYLDRRFETRQDYTDYSFFYDKCCGYGSYITDNAGNIIDPSQNVHGNDHFTKLSQELRISSPTEKRLRVIAGLFYQRQTDNIRQEYTINGLRDTEQVTGTNDAYWLTQQERVDRDYAIFGEAAFDVTDKLTLTGGGRVYKYDNTLVGFFGYGPDGGGGISSGTGQLGCFGGPNGPVVVAGSPCTNLGIPNADGSISPQRAKGNGFIHRLNLSYKFDADHLAYFTWSRGFRPGGINRRGGLPPYRADFLVNYEVGFKTSWFDRRLRFNGAAFLEDWSNFQFSFLGQNGLTNIRNAPSAQIKGIETDITWVPVDALTLSFGAAYTDAKLTQDFCSLFNPDGSPIVPCPEGGTQAFKNDRLPVTPRFKANALARYQTKLGSFDAHLQGTVNYQGFSYADLRSNDSGGGSPRDFLGRQKAYTLVDFTAGVAKGEFTIELYLHNAFDSRASLNRYSECREIVCANPALGGIVYNVVSQPRTIGLRLGQHF